MSIQHKCQDNVIYSGDPQIFPEFIYYSYAENVTVGTISQHKTAAVLNLNCYQDQKVDSNDFICFMVLVLPE